MLRIYAIKRFMEFFNCSGNIATDKKREKIYPAFLDRKADLNI